MKTIQMTIDEELLSEVDTAVRELGTSRPVLVLTRDSAVEVLTGITIA